MTEITNIKIYNTEHYQSFDEALKSGAVYSTPSGIDGTANVTGLFVANEIVDAVSECLGCKSIVAGVVNNEGQFITLREMAENLQS